MGRYGSDSGVEVIVYVVTIIVLLLGALIYAPISCASRWEGVYKTQWTITGGCRVEVSPGKWVPEKNVREVEP